ncbi:MFS transporter [Micromonospora sp. WP24]|nr:MFS transporter [Micromonospora sp. WP24]
MTRKGPLAHNYPAVATMVVAALVPYLVVSVALDPLTPVIARDLGMSTGQTSLAVGLANAGYALGTVLSVQLAQHLPQRRMMLVYTTFLVIGSVFAAAATEPILFLVGHVLQGLCTSLLLIAAVPPLITGFPPSKLTLTAVILNLSIFGGVALGPLIAGVQLEANGWRPLFWVIAGIAAVAFLLSLLTYQHVGPADPTATRSPIAVALATAGCVAAFYGVSRFEPHRALDIGAIAPLAAGLVLIVILLIQQYRAKRPLLILRPLTSTLPVVGIVVAMSAAATSVPAIALTGVVLRDRYTPLELGLLYLPEFGGAVIAAIVFAKLFTTRALHYFALVGMLSLITGIALIATSLPPTTTQTLIATGLIGVGVGASVTPALFIAGFSLRNNALQRVFAIVELLRAVAAFMIAPILLYIAASVGDSITDGVRLSLWICLGLASAGTLLAIALYPLGGIRPPSPSMQTWFGGDTAWRSPPLLAALNRRSTRSSDT